MRRFIPISIVLATAACATVPAGAPAYHRAQEPVLGSGNVYFYRTDTRLKPAPMVIVDSLPLFAPPDGAYTVVPLPAGKHQIEVRWAPYVGVAGLNFPIEVTAGASAYIKISDEIHHDAIKTTWRTSARHVSESVAEAELRNCCRFMESSLPGGR